MSVINIPFYFDRVVHIRYRYNFHYIPILESRTEHHILKARPDSTRREKHDIVY